MRRPLLYVHAARAVQMQIWSLFVFYMYPGLCFSNAVEFSYKLWYDSLAKPDSYFSKLTAKEH